MCKYCTEDENKHKEIKEYQSWNDGLGLDLINDRLYVTTTEWVDSGCPTCGNLEEELYHDGIQIKYCPMCGEKLT